MWLKFFVLTSITNFASLLQIVAGYCKAMFLVFLPLGDTGHRFSGWHEPGEHIFTWLPGGCLFVLMARGRNIPATCTIHPEAVEHSFGLQCGCHHDQSFTADYWLHVSRGSEESCLLGCTVAWNNMHQEVSCSSWIIAYI